VYHTRLVLSKIANFVHLLNFPFALCNDLSGLKRHELPKLVF